MRDRIILKHLASLLLLAALIVLAVGSNDSGPSGGGGGSTTPSAPPIESTTPSDPPAPRGTITPPARDEMIVDVFGILGKSIAEIEMSLGKGTEITPIKPGDFEAPPGGGESRTYNRGKYIFFLFFDRNGIAKRFQLYEGLAEENYSLDDWEILLKRFGVNLSQLPPDEKGDVFRRWNNLFGYKIEVFGLGNLKPNNPVWSVKILKLR